MGVLTREVSEFVNLVTRKAAEQGGVISGDNPTTYLPTDPFRLWVIQLVIILAMSEFLHFFLRRIRQPRVIAEVIGGILLGPTVMMRIPGFKQAIFPDSAMPGLALTSTIGLVMFLFLVGLEVDTKIIKRNFVSATSISVAGLLVPLGLGAAVGVGIYKNLVKESINFGYFVLFSAVAVGITAFPVLCRILTELKLLDTTVGVVTLGAGVGNDIIGWILLALAVALVNASTGLTALYVLLACVGYILVLLMPGRWAYVWLARRTGSLEQGSPTPFLMTITLALVMLSAFFTDIIGVHPIFGGFVTGLIIPHENGYAISLVEKLEDLVNILFIPIYFTLSGLKTDLSALNTGTAGAFTVVLCLVSFCSKFFPCYIAAWFTGFNWREAGAIGALMSCKGLVELIVLNVGLQAGILDTRTFSMFVVHALVLTVITTPLTLFFYPAKYRVRIDGGGAGVVESGKVPRPLSDTETKSRFALILDKIEQLPAAMTICQLLQPDKSISPISSLTVTDEKGENGYEVSIASQPRIAVNALRLIELTSRTSAVLKSQLIYHDPVVAVFRTFGYLNRLLVSAAVSVVNYDEFTTAISNHVVDSNSHMVILPWSRGTPSEDDQGKTNAFNPFDGVFHKSTTHDPTNSVVYSEFIRKVFATSPSPVALYVDRGISTRSAIASDHHLFLPFFGGPDDRLALSFVVQLCSSPSVQATVFRIQKIEDLSRMSTNYEKVVSPPAIAYQTIAAVDTLYGQPNTETRLASDTADNLIWNRYASSSDVRDADIASALSRIRFDAASSSQPLHTIVELVKAEMSRSTSSKDMIVVLGRSRRMAVENHRVELQQLIAESGSPIGSSVSKTLGDVGAALVATSTNANLLVLQGGA